MKIAIAGGTGFVGEALTNHLLNQKHNVIILTRNTSKITNQANLQLVEWLTPTSTPEKELEGIDVFINLAGESLNSGRWTKRRKERIIKSRIQATSEVKRIISSLERKPNVLINASAIGIYGTSEDKTFTENSTDLGSDFLARTVSLWENEANQVTGVRTILARFGVILGENAGALPRMVMPYRFFIGGTIGSGKQWLSWIHIDDVVNSIDFMIHNEDIHGPVNLTSPTPSQMKPFGHSIGKVLGRPHWIPVPGFALKLLLGQMSILVLEGQRVLPEKLKSLGYHFKYEQLDEALSTILRSKE